MKCHTLETNFRFIRDLQNAKMLGTVKLTNFYENFEETEETLFRSIYFKKGVIEYKPPSNTKRIELTEYKNNIISSKQKVKR